MFALFVKSVSILWRVFGNIGPKSIRPVKSKQSSTATPKRPLRLHRCFQPLPTRYTPSQHRLRQSILTPRHGKINPISPQTQVTAGWCAVPADSLPKTIEASEFMPEYMPRLPLLLVNLFHPRVLCLIPWTMTTSFKNSVNFCTNASAHFH